MHSTVEQRAVVAVSVTTPGHPPIAMVIFSKGQELLRVEDSGAVYFKGALLHQDEEVAAAIYNVFPQLQTATHKRAIEDHSRMQQMELLGRQQRELEDLAALAIQNALTKEN